VWLGDRHRERQLKGRGKSRACPVCRPGLRLGIGAVLLLAATSSLLDQCGARRGGRRSVVRCSELRNGAHGPLHAGRGPAGYRYTWPVACYCPGNESGGHSWNCKYRDGGLP
jgi:hypothetical protein